MSNTLEKMLHGSLWGMDESPRARLKRLRKEKNLTQTQLATMAGVGQTAIGNIEAGIRGYGASVVKVAAALGVSPDYLLMNTDDPGNAQPVRLPAQTGQVGERFEHWLSKIHDRDTRERVAAAAMQVVYTAIDRQNGLLPSPIQEPVLPSKKRRASRQDH